MDKACNFQEKSVGVLIELENTNILRCLLSHFDELRDLLKDKPTIYAALCNALKTFKGPVMVHNADNLDVLQGRRIWVCCSHRDSICECPW
jgi:hypothetical protein